MKADYLKDQKFDLTIDKNSTVTKHKPKILILYGSLRSGSKSKLLAEEANRILNSLGAEVKYFDPMDLPPFDGNLSSASSKVSELTDLVQWSEGQVWSSPEYHGNMSGLMKTIIDWIPLSSDSLRLTQGKTLAVMQVTGGSQSFNAVNNMRILGRWMRMIVIPNQTSVPKAHDEFDGDGFMKASPLRDRLVDVMEELVKFTYLTRDNTDFLVNRYSERKKNGVFV